MLKLIGFENDAPILAMVHPVTHFSSASQKFQQSVQALTGHIVEAQVDTAVAFRSSVIAG
jgi:hypothetical protein